MTQAYFSREAVAFPVVQQKALLVWGCRDRTHQRSDAESALPYFRDASLIHFRGAGHCPDLEEPERFAELLLAFSAAL